MLFLENVLFRAQYLLTPIAKQFSTSKTNFGYELPLSVYFPVLLLATRSLEIKALGTALEEVEVNVLEDDAI